MNTYFTSDYHIAHNKILDYTDRGKVIFKEKHTEWLIDIWNFQVQEEDTVYHLGDLSFGKYKETADAISQLKGKIILLKGNHDSTKTFDALIKDKLIDSWHYYLEIKIKGNTTCLFHFPIAAWHKQGYGCLHLHGHSHGMYQGQGKSLDVGLDNSYILYGKHRLFSEEDIVTFMQGRETVSADGHKVRA